MYIHIGAVLAEEGGAAERGVVRILGILRYGVDRGISPIRNSAPPKTLQ